MSGDVGSRADDQPDHPQGVHRGGRTRSRSSVCRGGFHPPIFRRCGWSWLGCEPPVATPTDLMAQYERDRTVQGSGARRARTCTARGGGARCGARAMRRLSSAPVEPVGLNAVLGEIDQNNVLATVRATEVVADPTVALALQAAWRRRGGVEVARMCAAHRVLRQQAFDPPALQHFHLFGLVTGRRSQPDHRSEVEAITEHVDAHLAIIAAARELGAPVEQAVVRVSDTALHLQPQSAGVAVQADVSESARGVPSRSGSPPWPTHAAPGGRGRSGTDAHRRGVRRPVAGRPHPDRPAVAYYDGLQLRIDGNVGGSRSAKWPTAGRSTGRHACSRTGENTSSPAGSALSACSPGGRRFARARGVRWRRRRRG